jgi:hypothetical protein
MIEVAARVAAAVEAANANDTAAFLACFTPDGVVDDWGQELSIDSRAGRGTVLVAELPLSNQLRDLRR